MADLMHAFLAQAGVKAQLPPATQAALERAKAESQIYICMPRRCGRTIARKAFETYLGREVADGKI